MDKILDYIKAHTREHGFEPEKMAIHKATGEPRPKIDAMFDKYVESGQVELLATPRSKNYILKEHEA